MATNPHVEMLTVEDYRQLPAGGPQYQLVEGELLMAPAPNRYHQDIVGNLYALLRQHTDKTRCGRLYVAPFDVHLDDLNVVQPDITYVSNDNTEILTDDGAHGAPDLVIEVISPATALLDKRSKRVVYARSGVKELWLVEPVMTQVHIFDLVNQPNKAVKVLDEGETFASAQFPGLQIQVADIFKR